MKKVILSIAFASSLFSGLAFAGCPVNVNTADAAEIERCLDGVGAKTAAKIIEYREANGPFKTVEDLTMVKGIGEKLVAKNEANIRFSE